MDVERQFFQWDYHQSHLQIMFSHQLDQGRFCDVTLSCDDGQTIRAHRAVLSACSNYFDSVLSGFSSAKDTLIIMKDCKFTEIKLLVEFMYRGEISIEQDQLLSLRKTAQSLQIKGLTEAFGSFDETEFDAIETIASPESSYSHPYPSTSRKRPRSEDARIMIPDRLSSSSLNAPGQSQIFLPQSEIQEEETVWHPIVPKAEDTDNSSTFDQDYYEEFEVDNSSLMVNNAEPAHSSTQTYGSNRSQSQYNLGCVDFLSTQQKWQLNTIPRTEIADITFLRKCLEFVYKDDLKRLANKSLSGRSNNDRKGALTPTKLHFIESIYLKRISGEENYDRRRNKFRRHLSNGIQTVKRKCFPQDLNMTAKDSTEQ